MTILSAFNFAESINDQVPNHWSNRIDVEIQNGQLTAPLLGVLGTSTIPGISIIELNMTPAASSYPAMSGVMLIGAGYSIRVTWSPTEELLSLCHCPPTVPNAEEEPITGNGEEGSEEHPEEDHDDHSILITTPLTIDTEHHVRVVMQDGEATLTVDGTVIGSIECEMDYQHVQVFASCGTRLRTLEMSSQD